METYNFRTFLGCFDEFLRNSENPSAETVLTKFDKDIEDKYNELNEASFPLSEKQYNTFFEHVDRGRTIYIDRIRIIEEQKIQLEEKKVEVFNLLDEKIKRYKKTLELLDKFAKGINDNKFKFGLHGEIKSNFGKTFKKLPKKSVEKDVAEQPYREMPGRGGRKKTRRKKNTRRYK